MRHIEPRDVTRNDPFGVKLVKAPFEEVVVLSARPRDDLDDDAMTH